VPQDVVLVEYPEESRAGQQGVATARARLLAGGINLLHTPCLNTLLANLPSILQQQYNYEKVPSLTFHTLAIN